MKTKKLLALALPLLGICLSSCSGSGAHHEASDYYVDMEYKTDFKVLQLSDIHVTMTDDLDLHFKFIDLTINQAKPDLIICTGDQFTFATRSVADKLFDFIDGHNIPWAVTFGNHDEQTYFSATLLSENLNTKYKNCKFHDILNDDVFGNANYCINLNKDGKVKHQLFVLDSNRYRYDVMGYDNFHDDQIAWYERMVKDSTNKNGGTAVPSFAFFHIPFEEYKVAWDLHKSGSSEVKYYYGENNEKVSCSKIESNMFEKMLELGSTKATFVGHDHVNNSDIEYKGIRLVYGVHSTNRVYAKETMMGGQVITIHDDNRFDIERIYHTYEEVK